MSKADSNLRVLVVRLGAMGDILHGLPAVTALRLTHPDLHIGWAIEPRWRPLLMADSAPSGAGRSPAMPLVDEVFAVPARHWSRHPLSPATLAQIGDTRSQLRHSQFDVVVDLQGAVRSALLARAAGAPRVIGEAFPREKAARLLFNERVPTTHPHVIGQAVEVANAVYHEQLPCPLPLLPTDTEAAAWAYTLATSGSGPIVLMSAGAGWGAKRWPAERYGELALRLSREGARVFLNAGPAEQALAQQALAACGHSLQLLDCTLGQLIEFTRLSQLVIAGDTGPLHLGCALGKPAVGIFGPTDPARNGPFGVPFQVLRNPESRRDHTRREEPESGLLTITVQQVYQAAEDLLRLDHHAHGVTL